MRIEERILIPSAQAAVWDFVWQTERLAACLPGCTQVEALEEGRRYHAVVEDRIGPYRVEADLEITVDEAVAPERIRLHALGKDRRLGSTQRVALEISLVPSGERETALTLVGDVEVLGKVASLGQFAIKRKMNEIMAKFGANLQAACGAGAVGADA